MAANGLGPEAFEELRLERGHLFVVDARGRRFPVCHGVVAWTISDPSVDLPDEFRFERIERTPSELSKGGLDGGFDPKEFRVVDDVTDMDVHVRLIAGRSRAVVLVGFTGPVPGTAAKVPTA